MYERLVVLKRHLKHLCSLYGCYEARKYQLKLKRYKNGNCDISDKPLSGRQPSLNGELLKAIAKLNLCQSAGDLV